MQESETILWTVMIYVASVQKYKRNLWIIEETPDLFSCFLLAQKPEKREFTGHLNN